MDVWEMGYPVGGEGRAMERKRKREREMERKKERRKESRTEEDRERERRYVQGRVCTPRLLPNGIFLFLHGSMLNLNDKMHSFKSYVTAALAAAEIYVSFDDEPYKTQEELEKVS